MSKLSLDQEAALIHLHKSGNIFLTGGAGTGKSYVIREFLKNNPSKIPVLASTGAAAILLGGRTFHSFFGLGILQGGPEAAFQKALLDKRLRKRLRDAHTIIIDEISMLSWEVLDCAERIASAHRDNLEPWGGLRIVAVGDFAQLPPVVKARYGDRGPLNSSREWAFLGEAWAKSEFRKVILRETMRTADEAYLRVLKSVREGEICPDVDLFLREQMREEPPEEATFLFPRKKQTELFNRGRLEELGTKLHIIPTEYLGAPHGIEMLKRDAPIGEALELKEGALVMIRMNDPKQRFVNGSTGTIRKITPFTISVALENSTVDIEPFAFTVHDADGNELASAKNFPLSLAYASTIHKVQGATLDRIHVDLQHLWEPGQAYVALSRVRRRKDVTLSQWSSDSFRADDMVKAFYGQTSVHSDAKQA